MTLLYVPDEASIIKGVNRLPPAHSFVYDLNRRQLTLKKYWQLRFDAEEERSEDEWGELLRVELSGAVRRWSLSDVPIACSLSGGLDSSAVVGLLAEAGHSRIKTYSLGFSGEAEQQWNEIDLARQVAQRWGTDHHEIILEPKELLSDLAAMVWHLDEPYGGGLPSWYVFKEMSRDVKVGLTGTGGDELFGNYGKFKTYESSKLLRASLALGGGETAEISWPVSSLPSRGSVIRFLLPGAGSGVIAYCLSCRGLSMSRSAVITMPISNTFRTT